MDWFFVDSLNNQKIDWSKLILDIRNISIFNPYVNTEDYYEIFKTIIVSKILEEDVVLLDSDLSNVELLSLTNVADLSVFDKNVDVNKLNDIYSKNDLILKLKMPSLNWKITLFTSGTTGLPKKIVHNYGSITKGVRSSESHTKDIWGLAYNPTHMAGIQVFFQAALNGNMLVRLFGYTPSLIIKEINNYNITNISATPTFYRMLLNMKFVQNSVKRITCGGERFDIHIWQKLLKSFPNVKITNIYASTEAGTLFHSSSDVFTVKSENLDFVKVENCELFIHQRLLGDFNNGQDCWFKTNDLVDIVSKNPLSFKFIARTQEVINIGGYNVIPSEVEQLILAIPGVVQAVVYPKKNSVLGNILCSDIVINNEMLTEVQIRIYLKDKLQEYKIPRIIKIVNSIDITRTGKINRNIQ